MAAASHGLLATRARQSVWVIGPSSSDASAPFDQNTISPPAYFAPDAARVRRSVADRRGDEIATESASARALNLKPSAQAYTVVPAAMPPAARSAVGSGARDPLHPTSPAAIAANAKAHRQLLPATVGCGIHGSLGR
jgi:hypothetical protein